MWRRAKRVDVLLNHRSKPAAKNGEKMQRIYFAAMAAFGCMAMGVHWSERLSKRVGALQAWARVLVRLEAGLTYRAQTMEEIIQKVGEAEEHPGVKAVLLSAAGAMRENPLMSLYEVMRMQSFEPLTPGDCTAMAPLFQGLGGAEEISQHDLIRAVRASIDIQLLEARDAAAKNRRLAHSLGVIGGFAVFLFLL